MNLSREMGKAHSHTTRYGPLHPALNPVARLASCLYVWGVNSRNRRFDADATRAHRLPLPVVSIGNITAGGTGKTPFTSWLADVLTTAGRNPVIAMRGYKARHGKESDEQSEHRRRLPNIDVVANPDRHAALLKYLKSNSECDCVLLDDGFQHRQLAREIDLVLVDATAPLPDQDRLLPAGWLREPAENLTRADAVILTRADLKDEARLDRLRKTITRLHGKPPLAEFCHAWSHLTLDMETQQPTTWLAQKRLVVTCGIGNPKSVIDMAGQCGAVIVATHVLKDHAPFTSADVNRIKELSIGADAVLTTEKDWSKLEPLLRQQPLDVPIVRPFLEMTPLAGTEPLTQAVIQACTPNGIEHNDR
ncbi:MAG: tetraacyldisaccharide 4'-kinase [Planctomycetes bacterium]|nr:tetraacyldisaccharide 4'-kinase [Planctomycetota bacterium]